MALEPALLYLTPVIPAFTGNGLAMRCGMILEALKAKYRVSILVIQLYPGLTREIPEMFRRGCERAVVIDSPTRPVSGFAGWVRQLWQNREACLADLFNDSRFDVVHIFRLAMFPFARRWLANRPRQPRLHLDLDEIDSETHLRMAALCRANGDLVLERLELQLAEQARAAEQESYATVDRIYLCSGKEVAVIPRRAGLEVTVLPNGVRPAPALLPAPRKPPYRFVFVGTLGYYPNEDAALYLCREIMPCLRAATAHPVCVEIVGDGASARLRQAAADAGVALMGALPDLRLTYENTTAVLVPIRAGGGTRIKILEAFSYGRPVISSRVGAEGIEAARGREILFAETPDDFVTECTRLIEDTELSKRLSANALRLVSERYSPQAVREALDTIPGNDSA